MNRKLLLLLIGVSLTVIVKGQAPVADFTTSTGTKGCASFLVSFQNLSTNTPAGTTTWKWDFGNGAVSSQPAPTYSYTTAGVYTVKLTATTAAGTNTMTKTAYITVQATPVADFSSDITTGCFPLKVQFKDNSTSAAPITSWLWDFGDGTNSTTQNATHTYNGPTPAGGSPVTLQVTDQNGCSGISGALTKPGYINIPNGIKASFNSVNTSVGCKVPIGVDFNNLTAAGSTAPNISYAWDFGDSHSSTVENPHNDYGAAGSYTVTLTAKSPGTAPGAGCQDVVSQIVQLTASGVHSSFTSPDIACIGAQLIFQNTSNPSPDATAWTFGDGTSSTDYSAFKTYNTTGTFTVTLKNTFGPCQDIATKTVTIQPYPKTDFKADVTASCKSSLTVNFSDLSTNATAWTWNFGDGSTSTSQNPSHTYTAFGAYNVTLTTSSASGCNDSLTKAAYINLAQPSLTVYNLPYNGCTPASFTPIYALKAVDGVATYSWDFGNGATSAQSNPTVTYGTQGTYNVNISITTKGGCTLTKTGIAKAGNPGSKPKAAFSAVPSLVCPFENITFTDQSTGTPPPNDWIWTMGDGNSVSGKSTFTFSYPNPGSYRILLTAITDGCIDTISQTVTIKPPKTDFNFTNDCSNRTQFTFIDKSNGATVYSWNFNDGSPLNSTPSPVHNFPAGSASYQVLLVTMNGACRTTQQKTVSVVAEKADFSLSPVLCKSSPLKVSAINSNPKFISNYTWDFGDGTPAVSGSPSASHMYAESGNYTVTLTITDLNGCKDSKQYPLRVNGPVAGFFTNTTSGCKGLTVTMTDQTVTDGTHNVVKWNWDYGDGTSIDYTAPPFSHTYTTQGIFSIRLIATDASGCIDSITKYNLITVNIPRARFSSVDSMSCPGSAVVFDNASTGKGLQYAWDFGDGATSTDPGPSHVYANVGKYNVRLSLLDQFGCTDILTLPNYVTIDTPNAKFLLNDSISSCPPLKSVFTFQGHYAQSTVWDFGDNAISFLPSPVHSYNIPGNYTATLTVTSPGGCIAKNIAHIKVSGPYGTVTASALGGCTPLKVNFNVVTTGVVNYYWDFGDQGTPENPTTTVPTNTHTYTTGGTFLPIVTLQDAAGCNVPISPADSILVVSVKTGFSYDRNTLCDKGSVQFTDTTITNGPIAAWSWDFGDGSQSNDQNPLHFYAAAGLYTVKLVVTTQFGCTDSYTANNVIRIVSSPVVDFTGANSACVPATLQFAGIIVQPDTSALTWAWTFSNGQNGASPPPTGQTPPSQLYTVAGPDSTLLVVTNSSGCTDSVKHLFDIHPLPPVNAGIDTAVCLGNGVVLQATGANNGYAWLPPNNTLSCTNCDNPTATPTLNTSYIVQGTNNFNCQANDTVQVRVIQPTTLDVNPTDSLCIGQSLQLSATGTDYYTWSPGSSLNDSTIGNPIAHPLATTTYTVTATDYKYCFSAQKQVLITVFNYPTVDTGPDTVTLPVGSIYTINGVGSPDIVSINWTPTTALSCPTCLVTAAKPINTTTYLVRVTNNGGCATTDKITFIVTCNDQNFFVPNTFSPNGDGINDYFYVRGKGLNNVHSMQIFNRWGQKVFERRDFPPNTQSAGWDGTVNGQKAPGDVYIYVIEMICDNSAIIPYQGNITLIR